MSDLRLAFRASASDLANLDTIAAALTAAGRRFPTRSDAMRLALAVVAASPKAALAVLPNATTTGTR